MARLLLLLLLLLPPVARAQEAAILSERDRFHPAFGRHAMVVTQEAEATRIGLEVLKAGGNAVDAAVAVGFALAVTLPRAGNLGGGGFMLVHLAASGETLALDYRETAPAASRPDMFLDAAGAVDEEKARYSHAAAGVPGTVAGLAAAAERWGRLPLAALLAPAIRLAEQGVALDGELADSLNARRGRFARWPASAAIFLRADGRPWAPGDRLAQADLAATLRRIGEAGPAGFYEGPTAAALAADMAAHGGLVTAADLAGYRAVVREPARGEYRGWRVAAMPPPSSGGAHLIQLLNILEGYPLAEMGQNGAATLHVMAEAMKLAYADRAVHMGDPDFWPVPLAGLTSKAYATSLRAGIDPSRARPSTEIAAGTPPREGDQTTHFSIVDAAGNAVANTYTINFSYGSGIVAAGTGVLLNNEMDDFSAKPGAPNAYGLVGGEANAIAPGKRPLSSMTPAILFRDGAPALVTGSPGGSRIITTVLQVVLNVVDHGMNIAEASAAPRVHHQWQPDELRVEEGLSPDTLRLLRELGHAPVVRDTMGATMSILRVGDGWTGAADPRVRGGLALGY